MSRKVKVAVAVLLAALGGAPPARSREAQSKEPPPRDPLEEFVPHEKVDADSIVSFPVDI